MFEGDYRGNLRNGYGIRTWKNGTTWKGFWRESVPEGKGIYKFPDSCEVLEEELFLAIIEDGELYFILKKTKSKELVDKFLSLKISGDALYYLTEEEIKKFDLNQEEDIQLRTLAMQARLELQPYSALYASRFNKYGAAFVKLYRTQLNTLKAPLTTINIRNKPYHYYTSLLTARCPAINLLATTNTILSLRDSTSNLTPSPSS